MSREGATTEPDDEALVRAYQSDPEGTGRAAAGALIARWQGRAYAWAWRVLREREAALDAAQDALMQAYRALPRYRAQGNFSAWLFTIVHNRCLSAVRRRPLTRDPELEVDDFETALPGPAESYASKEAERRLHATIREALDARERTALWLRVFEGMNVEDITRLLELDGASGARGLLQTARRKLRAALQRAQESDERERT